MIHVTIPQSRGPSEKSYVWFVCEDFPITRPYAVLLHLRCIRATVIALRRLEPLAAHCSTMTLERGSMPCPTATSTAHASWESAPARASPGVRPMTYDLRMCASVGRLAFTTCSTVSSAGLSRSVEACKLQPISTVPVSCGSAIT